MKSDFLVDLTISELADKLCEVEVSLVRWRSVTPSNSLSMAMVKFYRSIESSILEEKKRRGVSSD